MNIRFLFLALFSMVFFVETRIQGAQNPAYCDEAGYLATFLRLDSYQGFYGEIDFLVLRADVNALAYGIGVDSNQRVTSGEEFPEPLPINRAPDVYLKMKNLHTHWDPGFRLGIGYACSDSWGLCAKYTQYHSSTTSHFDDPSPFSSSPFEGATGGLLPLYGISPISAMIGAIREARAKWKLDINLLDFEIKKLFDVGRDIKLSPFVGIRTAWIDQSYRIKYDVQQFVISPPDYAFHVKMANDYLGAGIIAGLDAEWEMKCGFSLFSKVAGSLVYGRFHVHQDLTNRFSPPVNSLFPGTTAPNSFLRDSFWLTRAIAEYALGLQWKRSFCNDAYVVSCKVLWEQQLFFGQNQLARLLYGSTNNHDLGLSGFSFDFGLDF